MTIMVF